MSLISATNIDAFLCVFGYLLPESQAKILQDLYDRCKNKYNFREPKIPNPPFYVPFLGAKTLNPNELSMAEVFFEEWADRQKPMQLIFSDTYNLFNQTLYVRGTTNGNTFASDVTRFFYVAFPEQEKDMSEPLNKLGIPFFEYNGGPKQDMTDIANDITTAQLMLPITIDSVSVIVYNPEAKKWDPITTFSFKGQ